MARVDPRQPLMPSILDRLISADASSSRLRQGYDLQQVIDAVRRDLEDLLNSHQMYVETLDEWPECSNSLLVYGIPDFTSLSIVTDADRRGVSRLLEQVITRFEPRLKNVKAKLIKSARNLEHNLRFQIEAQINVDPAPEIAFETVLELISGRATIKPSQTSE